MRPIAKLATSVAACSGLLTASAAAAPATEGGKRYTVTLTGEEECTNTGVCNQGDLDGTGTAIITVNRGQGRVCWDISVSGVEAIAAAHIHLGFAGRAFPNNIVVHLDTDTGCTTDVTDEVLDALMKAPQAFYVNVHNTPFPGGALRGQLA